MKVNFKKLPGSKIELEVTLDQKEFNDYWQPAYDEALRSVTVKGFRPGAAPKELSERAIDKDKVFGEAANRAVRATLEGERDRNGWIFIEAPKAEIVEATSLGSPRSGVSLKYRASATLLPEINLGNYKKIARETLAEQEAATVSEAEINNALGWIRDSRAKTALVDRAAASGDLIEIGVKSKIGGAPLSGGNLDRDRVVLGESRYMHGFDDALAGHRSGETVNFSLTAPSDYWQEPLKGKKIDFEVKIKGIFSRELPETDDSFARGLGSNFQTLSDLRKSITDGLTAEKEEKEKERIRAKTLDAIVKSCAVDIPQVLIERMLDSLVSEFKEMFGAGNASLSEAELRKKFAEKARARVMGHLVIHAIARSERIEPSKEEVEAEAKARRLDPDKYYDYIYGIVQSRKVFEFLEKQ